MSLYLVMEYLDKGKKTMKLDRTGVGRGTHLSDETQGNTSAFDRKLSSSGARR